MNIEETIFFYTRNDYLIVNSVLCKREEQLRDVIELANFDSKAVLMEHQEGQRVLDAESIIKYENRLYDVLTEGVFEEVINRAKNDALNIINTMKPINETTKLNRTISESRINDSFNQNVVGDILHFNNISSTSKTYYCEDEKRNYYRYEITVPAGTNVLELDQFDPFIRNEEGEVLLPPMECIITSIDKTDNEYCKAIIRLKFLVQSNSIFS